MTVTFAVVQFAPVPATVPGNIEKNKEKAAQFVKSAAEQGADVIVFPEYFLTGVIAAHTHLAVDEEEWLHEIQHQAKLNAIDIVAGTIVERSVENDENLFNRSYYVDKHGAILGSYDKRNLWHPEKEYLTASAEPHQVFETSYGKVGLLVCWDLAWPEAFRALMEQDVQVVIAPTYWVASDCGKIGLRHNRNSEATYLDHLCVTRAWDNGICLVFANVGRSTDHGKLGGDLEAIAGQESLSSSGRRDRESDHPVSQSDDDAIGRSGVFLPFYGALHHCTNPDETMFTVKVDLNVLKDAEQVYKIRADYQEYQTRARKEKAAQ